MRCYPVYRIKLRHVLSGGLLYSAIAPLSLASRGLSAGFSCLFNFTYLFKQCCIACGDLLYSSSCRPSLTGWRRECTVLVVGWW